MNRTDRVATARRSLRAAAPLVAGRESPEVLVEAVGSLSRLAPMMYALVVADVWMLATNATGSVPTWCTIPPAAALTALSLLQMARWHRRRHSGKQVTPAQAQKLLRRINLMTFYFGTVALIWMILLTSSASELTQTYAGFSLAMSVLICMFCLSLAGPAPFILAVLDGIPFVILFATSSHWLLASMAITMAIAVPLTLFVITLTRRGFAAMVDSRTTVYQLDKAQDRLLRMIDDMPVAVMTMDPETHVINYMNETSLRTLREIEDLLPFPVEQFVGSSIDDFQGYPAYQRRLLTEVPLRAHEARINLGPEVLDIKIAPVTSQDGEYLGPMLTWAIVTREAAAEEHIKQLAHFDSLTGLPNRSTFSSRLETAVTTLQDGHGIALLIVDLDGFKTINDTQGHSTGDQLLQIVAERLSSVCDAAGAIVARMGGDEFTVMLPYTDPTAPGALGEQILAAIGKPWSFDGAWQRRVNASIGMALAPEHSTDGETLFSYADLALYAAKAGGKATMRTFAVDLEIDVRERILLEEDLRFALETGTGMFVFFQPIHNIETGEVTAREALARWHHPVRGWVSPGQFVPVAEQSDLIDLLTAFVLDQACRSAVGRPDDEVVAVNISVAQLGADRLVPSVKAALEASGLAPHRLEVEVTETALLISGDRGIADLRALSALGVRVALDDFGTGYSSLAHLRAFPFNKIKIDGSFVRDSVERPDCAAVVRAVAELGSRLGLTTVAEGVETQEQLERVKLEGCAEVQGYLYGRPAPHPDDSERVDSLTISPQPAVAGPEVPITTLSQAVKSRGRTRGDGHTAPARPKLPY